MIASGKLKLKGPFSTEGAMGAERARKKIIVILGPTSSGKSALAVRLAKDLCGEIVSADSRQVYKGLDIGTGKITRAEMAGVPHYMLDVASPRIKYSVGRFQKEADAVIEKIIKRRKIPIIAGGSGFYIESVVYGLVFPATKADVRLRRKLSSKSAAQLFTLLKKLDSERAEGIDGNNKVRLIRALEIARKLGKVPKVAVNPKKRKCLLIGIDLPDKILKTRIKARLLSRIRKGMVAEGQRLRANGLSFKRMEELGLEYRYIAKFLKKEIDRKTFVENLNKKIWQYAKRQRTWFKRDKNIRWFQPKGYKSIRKIVANFLQTA